MNLHITTHRTPFRVMVCLVSLTAVLFCAPRMMRAQTTAPPDQLRTLSRDELDVVKVLTRQEHAWNKGDLDAFTSAYKDAPDTLFVGSHISHGYADLLAEYKRDFPTKDAMGTLTFSSLEPRILDERFAIVVGGYKLERSKKAGGNAEGAFSMVLEKTKDGWKIILDHTT